MKPAIIVFMFSLLFYQLAFSQSKLRITYNRFGHVKTHEFLEGEVLNFKIKGDSRYRTSKIVAMHDSLIVFESEDAMTLNELKLIRIKKHSYHNKLFQRLFTYGAVGYPLLTLTNNAINGVNPLLNERSMIVSGSFIAGILVLKLVGVKHIRMNKNKVMKIIDVNYQNLR